MAGREDVPMPRALLVTTSFLPGRGGIESYLAELCLELAPEVAVLAPASRDGKQIPPDLPYRTFPYPSQTVAPGPALIRAIDEAAQELDVDRIIMGTPWPLSLIWPRAAALG